MRLLAQHFSHNKPKLMANAPRQSNNDMDILFP